MVALNWYDDLGTLDRWIAADGPPDWPRFDDPLGPYDEGRPLATAGETVRNIEIDDHRISFETTAVGVPHLVKTSYFPNWEATGADGPYRAAPSLMIVVPTDEKVLLEFGNTWTENVGMLLTLTALAFVGWWLYARRSLRRRQSARSEV